MNLKSTNKLPGQEVFHSIRSLMKFSQQHEPYKHQASAYIIIHNKSHDMKDVINMANLNTK